MYANAHNADLVRRYPPNTLNGVIYAGTGSNASGTLNYPTGIAVDKNFTLYNADRDNKRIVKREQNGTTLVTVFNTASAINQWGALAFSQNSSDQIYISDEGSTKVVLWQFGAAAPSVTYTQVNDGTTLNKPRGIKLDVAGNLYVADQKNSRVVMFCVNSTVGIVIANLSGEPQYIAFDSKMNLYATASTKQVLKYSSL